MPVLAATFALSVSVELPATAVELPVSVTVQLTVPAVVSVGALQVAVKPLGNPEATLMLDPAVFATKPPTGIATTVAVTEESDETETELGETLRTAPGRGCTTKVMDLVLNQRMKLKA